MTFVGYEAGTKGYRFWNSSSQSVVISRDAHFNETSFMYRKDLPEHTHFEVSSEGPSGDIPTSSNLSRAPEKSAPHPQGEIAP